MLGAARAELSVATPSNGEAQRSIATAEPGVAQQRHGTDEKKFTRLLKGA